MPVQYEWAYRLRGFAMVQPYLILFLCTFAVTEKYLITWPVGLTVFNFGVAMRIWAQMHLHYRLPVQKVLTCTGPYRFMRNPVYVGNTMMLLGITFTSRLLWFLPIMLLWCLVVYSLVIRHEERHLLEKYGNSYKQYLHRVPRWLPKRNADEQPDIDLEQYFWPSIRAEIHCWLLLIPMVGREWFILELV